jgi:hypothetical protein
VQVGLRLAGSPAQEGGGEQTERTSTGKPGTRQKKQKKPANKKDKLLKKDDSFVAYSRA